MMEIEATAAEKSSKLTKSQATLLMRSMKYLDASTYEIFVTVFFGVVLVALLRFWLRGWVDEMYVQPRFHFSFPGLPEMPMGSPWLTRGLYGLMPVCLVLVLFRIWFSPALLVFLIIFSYFELLDAAYYLNHYVLVILLSAQILVLPRPKEKTVPSYVYGLLRLQLTMVYWGAALAKIDADWLQRGEPLATWLQFFLLSFDSISVYLSWLALLFDALIPLVLWHRRWYWIGIFLVCVFHLTTGAMLGIGMFPWLMMAGSLLFLPANFFRVSEENASATAFNPPAYFRGCFRATVSIIVVMAIHTTMLLRPLLVTDSIVWTERGMWLSWRVMVAEKTGQVRYLVKGNRAEQSYWHDPRSVLTEWQVRQMAVQPDLMLDYAHHLGNTLSKRTGETFGIYAASTIAINGKPSQPYLRSDVDLMEINHKSDIYLWLHPPPDDAH